MDKLSKDLAESRADLSNATDLQKRCEDLQDKVDSLKKEIQRMVSSLFFLSCHLYIFRCNVLHNSNIFGGTSKFASHLLEKNKSEDFPFFSQKVK